MADYQWQPLKDDKKFEELINALCIQEYKREFQLYGRNGQKQNGIDGKCSKGEICFQCKNKKDLKQLLRDLESDTQSMMANFTPVKSIFACAAPRDTKLQDKAQELSKKHSIEIIVWSWNEIEDIVEKYEDVAKKFYPHIYKIKIIIQNLDTKASDGLIQNIAIETEKHYASHNETLDKLLENEGFVDYLKKQIDYHLKTHTPLTEQLEKLSKQREEDKQEFAKTLQEAKGTDYEALLLEAQVAFDNYNEKLYREILDRYKADKAGQQYIKNLANSYYLKAKSYHRELNYPKALFEISEATRFDNKNGEYLHWYGYIANDMGDYDTSLKYYQKSLAIHEEVLGIKHPDTATSYNNIGLVYDSIGEYDKALEFYQKSLAIREEVLGIKHPDTATSYNNIGEVYKSKGEYDKALEFYQKALAIREEVLGIKHPDTATSYNNIAHLYYAMEKYEESAKYMQKAKDIWEKVLPDNHPNLMSAKENLSIIQQSIKPIKIDKSYLDAIKIKNYFSLIDVEIENLGDKREIYFVGENGDGKTILLQAIVLALKGRDKDYTKLAYDYIKEIKDKMILETKDTQYPSKYHQYKNLKNIFAYGINRNKVDEDNFDTSGYSGLFDTPQLAYTTFFKKPEKILSKKSPIVDKFIDKLEDLMDNKLTIDRNSEGELRFKGVDRFNMLSEGYKTTIIWLTDLLSRLMEKQPDIQALKDYEAIVLIDEVDLYLHPKWKYNFMYKLRTIFPKIQFIVTTHSLVTVLGASEDAVFYKLYRDEEGRTQVSQQIDDISHYTANILMTSPLFDLDSMKVRGFDKNERLSSDDYIYREIHQAVREYMQNNPSAMSEELKQKVKDELKARMAQLRQK